MSTALSLSPPARPSRPLRSQAYVPRSSPLARRAIAPNNPDDDHGKTRTGATPSRIISPSPSPSPSSSKSELISESSLTTVPSISHSNSSTRPPPCGRSPFSAPQPFKSHPQIRWFEDASTPPLTTTTTTHRRASSPNLHPAPTYTPRPIYGNLPPSSFKSNHKAAEGSERNWLSNTAPPIFSRAWTAEVVMPVKANVTSTSRPAVSPTSSTSEARSLRRRSMSLFEEAHREQEGNLEAMILDTKSEGGHDMPALMGDKRARKKISKWKAFLGVISVRLKAREV